MGWRRLFTDESQSDPEPDSPEVLSDEELGRRYQVVDRAFVLHIALDFVFKLYCLDPP